MTDIEPPTECPADELPFAREFVSRCRFVFARSVPLNPHWYSIDAQRQRDFDRFLELIARCGFRGRFDGVTYTYLGISAEDGTPWRYWRSPAYFPPGVMLNRADSSVAPMRLPGEPAHIDQDPQGQLWRPNHA